MSLRKSLKRLPLTVRNPGRVRRVQRTAKQHRRA